jgi:hypothetical protein
MKKKDWIILRVIRSAIKLDRAACGDIEIMRAFSYLINKYPTKVLYACIEQLNGELA